MLLEIFVAPKGCPSCGKAELVIKRVADNFPDVTVRAVHVLDAPDRVIEYGVFCTPFVVIDGALEFVGVPQEADLRSRILLRVERSNSTGANPAAVR